MRTHVIKKGAAALALISTLTMIPTSARAAAPSPPSIDVPATVYTLHHDGAIYTTVALTTLSKVCSQQCFWILSILSPKISWTAYACVKIRGASTIYGDWQIHQTGAYTYRIKTGELGGPAGCQDITYLLDTHLGTIHPLR